MLVIYWLLLFIGTHIPPKQGILPNLGHMDKLLHFSAYTGLAFLGAVVFAYRSTYRLLAYALLLATGMLYGMVDELSQIPVGRDAAWGDWFADVAGLITGLIAAAVIWSLLHGVRTDHAPS